jgi:hypothetical protein
VIPDTRRHSWVPRPPETGDRSESVDPQDATRTRRPRCPPDRRESPGPSLGSPAAEQRRPQCWNQRTTGWSSSQITTILPSSCARPAHARSRRPMPRRPRSGPSHRRRRMQRLSRWAASHSCRVWSRAGEAELRIRRRFPPSAFVATRPIRDGWCPQRRPRRTASGPLSGPSCRPGRPLFSRSCNACPQQRAVVIAGSVATLQPLRARWRNFSGPPSMQQPDWLDRGQL